MTLIGLIPVRNEAWIVGFSARAALRWCDALLFLNHASTDDTTAALASVPGRVEVIHESGQDWNEADYRQRLLVTARDMGGTHFALIDADEVLTANLLDCIRPMISALTPGECLRLPWICLWRSMSAYRSDNSKFGRARAPVAFADAPGLSHKAGAGGYQIHTRAPNGVRFSDQLDREDGGLLHFQHAEWQRLLAKQALYKMTERLRWGRSVDDINKTYDGTVSEDGLQTTELPAQWCYDSRWIIRDREPWQAAECRRLWNKYSDRFTGLDLYGVVRSAND